MGKVEQFVMAYGVEHDRLRAIMPSGFQSLRPVIRINGEIRDNEELYVEVNVPIAVDGKRGWLNMAVLQGVSVTQDGNTTTFANDLLEISFTRVGIQGGCPAEKDNDGCFYLHGGEESFVPAEKIDSRKEFCDCSFRWLTEDGTSGKSTGETLPAFPEEVTTQYAQEEFCIANGSQIPCKAVLGAYVVEFER